MKQQRRKLGLAGFGNSDASGESKRKEKEEVESD